jgi:hypothetical protein
MARYSASGRHNWLFEPLGKAVQLVNATGWYWDTRQASVVIIQVGNRRLSKDTRQCQDSCLEIPINLKACICIFCLYILHKIISLLKLRNTDLLTAQVRHVTGHGGIHCKFWTPGALGAGQKLPKIYHFPKIFFSRTMSVYIEYILQMPKNFLLLRHCDESVKRLAVILKSIKIPTA